jgi:hypothetical protein
MASGFCLIDQWEMAKSARGGIRTPDARLRTAALYPLSYAGAHGDASTRKAETALS